MPRKASSAPTKAELEILQILWSKGPSTVRDVHQAIGRAGYTSILKLLQIMTQKKLVVREEQGRAHIYKAKVAQQKATGGFMKDLIDRVFGGSSKKLIMQALGESNVSREDLQEMRKLIDEMEGK